MKKYSDCMTAAEKKNPPKRMRVSQKLMFTVSAVDWLRLEYDIPATY
jgi:hypothetical protein